MTKKYKLIKIYPGSPELGTIISQLGTSQFYEDKSSSAIMKGCFDSKILLKHPEFWEKVVEKDYEILSVISNLTGEVENVDSEGYVDFGDCVYVDDIIESKNYDIYSVKRKSDGQIFTIGDKIQYYSITGQKSHTHIIDNITIYQNNVLLNHNHLTWKSHGDFNKVQKVKRPLFTTEDGVEI